jgi:uncharacterized protein YutE (UPF0331/DUF86 family)
MSEVLSTHSLADFKEDYDTQGIIFTNLDQAMDHCADLGEEIVKTESWGKTESLEDIFYILNEKSVIGSDLVNRMIAMYRIRRDRVEDKIEENDLELVDEILRQDLEDIQQYLREVGEYYRRRRKPPKELS